MARNTIRMLGGIFVVLAGAILLAACGSSGGSDSTAASSGDSGSASVQGEHVILSSCANSNPFCGVLNHHVISELEAAGISVTLLENELTEPAVQFENMNQAISQHPDAIVVLETDTTSMVSATAKAKAAGIPVINIDGRADPAAAESLAGEVLANNEELGEFAAENIIEGLETENRKSANVIAITGTQSSLSVQDRMKGFKKVMATAPQYKLVAEEDAHWDPVETGKIAAQLFAQWESKGGIQAAYGMADYMAVPIVQAAKQAGLPVGLPDGIVISGSNCNAASVEAIKAGEMVGSGSQLPGPEGVAVAKYTVELLEGKELEKTVLLPESRITPKNIAKFSKECSKT